MTSKKLVVLLCLSAVFFAGFFFSEDWWEKKPYSAWSKQECGRMLESSPWAATLTRLIHPEQPAVQGIGTNIDFGQTVTFRVRFLTAEPVRMAIMRLLVLGSNDRFEPTLLHGPVEQPDHQDIVVAMDVEVAHKFEEFHNRLVSLRTPDLINNTYLTTDSGKLEYLRRYDPPGEDGLGAKFHFSRTLPDGTALITAKDRKLRFETNLSMEGRQSVRTPLENAYSPEHQDWEMSFGFDLKKMVYRGKLAL